MDRYLGEASRARRASAHDVAASYATAIKSAFDVLISVATQLSAALLTMSINPREWAMAEASVESARLLHAEALNLLRAVRVPDEARHFHMHIERATRLLGESVSASGARRLMRGVDIDVHLAQLRCGWHELNRATSALPGLSVLNLRHCCGARDSNCFAGWLPQR